MAGDEKCFFCGYESKVACLPQWSCSSLYDCEYCGKYILDSQGFDILRKDENKFKMACVLNERRLKGFGGIVLDDETKKEDLVCGYPRISVNELLAQYPQTAGEFLNRTLLNLNRLAKPFDMITLDLEGMGDCLHLFRKDKQGSHAFLRELENEGLIRFNRVPAGLQLNVFSLTTKCYEAVENLQNSGVVKREDKIRSSSNQGEKSMEWDLFLCHASEDKEGFVEPLANALKETDIKVWYDRFELKLGDSLRGKIDEGLANSRYGVVVLSRSFFEKQWPKKELDALVSIENEKGEKVILPIWHEIGIEEVRRFSPILASKLAAQSSDSLESIVVQILKVVNENAIPKTAGKEETQQVRSKDRGDLARAEQGSLQEIVEVLKNFWEDKDFEVAKSALPPIAKTYDILCRSKLQCGAKTTDVISWLGSGVNDGTGYRRALLDEFACPEVVADFEKWQEKIAERERGNKDTRSAREGMIEPKPPEIFQKILWTWKYGRQHWKLVCAGILVLLVSGMYALPKFNLFGNKYQGANLETENTRDKPIVVASATVEVKITSDWDFNGRVTNGKAALAFVKGAKPLLITSTIGYAASQTGNNEVIYKARLDMDAKDSAVGNPTSFLKDTDYIQIEFGNMPPDSSVLEGDVICIINNSVRLEFSIPPQKLVNNRIFIRNLSESLRVLNDPSN